MVEQQCCIKEILALYTGITDRASNDDADIFGLLFYNVNTFIALRDKIAELEKIAGGVAANAKL